MVYKYTPAQEKRYRETGQRPKTSELKRHRPGKKPFEPTYTYKGQTLTKAQHEAAIAHDIQREYLDKGRTPPSKLLRMAGLRVSPPEAEAVKRAKADLKKRPTAKRLGAFQEMERRLYEHMGFTPKESKRISQIEAARQQKVLKIQVPSEKEVKKIEFKKWQQKDFPKWVTDIVGDPLKLSDRERQIVLPFYGKTSAEALQQKQATTSFLNFVAKEVKTNPEKIALFLALPPALKVAGRGIQAAGITKLITKVPHGQLIARRTVQLVSAGIGAVYSKNVYDRVTEPIFTDYKDGKTTTTQKTLPNGDIEITTTTEQIPQFRKPTGPEQIERVGGIFATELAPLAISHRIINRGVKRGYKPETRPKSKVKISTKIMRAGKIIKTKVKTKTKEFIKAEKAEAQLILKKKAKTKKKAKAEVKPKAVTINLMKDPKAMAQLRTAQAVVGSVSKTRASVFMRRISLTRAKTEASIYSKTRTKRIMTLEDKIYSMETSIKMKQEFGLDVKFLQKQLAKLKFKLYAEQTNAQVAYFKKLNDEVISFLRAETKASAISINKELAILKSQAKQVTSAKQKAVLLSKAKAKLKQLTKQRALLIAYSKAVPDTKQKQRLKVIVTTVSKQIDKVKIVKKLIIKTVPVITPIKKTPKLPPKKPPKKPPKRPPKRPPKKPPIMPPIIPVIPTIPIKKKVKPKKKKKIKPEEIRAYKIINPIPTLAQFMK